MSLIRFALTGSPTISGTMWVTDGITGRRASSKIALSFGSRTLWTDLLAHGLVDELHLMIGPKIVAGDHRAFEGVAETDLRLIGVRTWGGSDNVVLSYGLGGSPR